MPEIIVLALLLVGCSPMIHMALTGLNWLILKIVYTRRAQCDCATPSWGMIGQVFICPECLRHWSVWWDDFSTGWGWMTYHARLCYKLGMIEEKDIRQPDPPPASVAESERLTFRQREVNRVKRKLIEMLEK